VKPIAILLACVLLAPALPAADRDVSKHPLLELARDLEKTREPRSTAANGAPDLKHAEHALRQADAPPDAECARSIGASTYAELHVEVAMARESRGDFSGAAQAYRRALACSPRSGRFLANLADALFDGRDLAGARVAIREALEVNPRSVMITRIAANIDYIEERWADAVSRFRYVAASEPDRNRAAYAQLMYWLAQKRAGVAKPDLVARRLPDEWPRPLLLYLQGEYTEAELVVPVREGGDEYSSTSVDERLCEALYYVGEAHWANGNPDLARDYFAAMVNLRMLHYIEHGLALAEIARLAKRRQPQAPTTTPQP
jgi:Flp pilus assembly protein TadD